MKHILRFFRLLWRCIQLCLLFAVVLCIGYFAYLLCFVA